MLRLVTIFISAEGITVNVVDLLKGQSNLNFPTLECVGDSLKKSKIKMAISFVNISSRSSTKLPHKMLKNAELYAFSTNRDFLTCYG